VFPLSATHVTAKVLRQGSAPVAYLPSQPDIPDGTVLPTLTIEIEAARQAHQDIAMGPANGLIEAYSRAPVPVGIVGRRIEAVLTLVGTTRASRWLISEIRPLPE